jgi:hypothetical protein
MSDLKCSREKARACRQGNDQTDHRGALVSELNTPQAYISGLLRRLDGVHSVKQCQGDGARFHRFGAVRVNAGCVPKKMMWNTARVALFLAAAGNDGSGISVGGSGFGRLAAWSEIT